MFACSSCYSAHHSHQRRHSAGTARNTVRLRSPCIDPSYCAEYIRTQNGVVWRYWSFIHWPLKTLRVHSSHVLLWYLHVAMGRDRSVGIATRCGTDGPGFASVPIPGPGDQQSSSTMWGGSFLGVKRPGRGVDHPPASSAEVKEGVELYIYSPSGPHGVF